MEINLVAETVKFLILGMSTVFAFLIVLVCVMYAQGKIISKYFPHSKETHDAQKTPQQSDNKAIVAAIATAFYMRKKSSSHDDLTLRD